MALSVLLIGCPLTVIEPGWGLACPDICCTVLVGPAWGGAQLVWLETVLLATFPDIPGQSTCGQYECLRNQQ
jgi:hypothetical protein